MAETHRSAMGRNVDMAALRQKNERVRAVGNMLVNARGDTIDSNGNVIQDNNKRVNEYYMKAVMNRAARTGESPVLAGRQQVTPTQVEQSQPKSVPDADAQPFQLTEEEQLFEQEDTDLDIPSKSKKSNSSK
jgi:hypothetical protein